ncbi:MAG: hypothetical protein DLM61_01480 [Pseudonocardiales bacterium]|nr:MAG: hypothetical protein DLM61_01480 [Pseudonocardiales bacterium]
MAPAAATIDDLWAMDAGSVRSIVLILHGGQVTSIKTAGRGRGPYLRMIPFAAALHRRGRAQGLSVRLLLYRYRGWNEPELHPLADARWALDHLGEQRPAVPVAPARTLDGWAYGVAGRRSPGGGGGLRAGTVDPRGRAGAPGNRAIGADRTRRSRPGHRSEALLPICGAGPRDQTGYAGSTCSATATPCCDALATGRRW